MSALLAPVFTSRVTVEVAREQDYGVEPASYSYFRMMEDAIGSALEGESLQRPSASRSEGTVPTSFIPTVTALPDLATELDGSMGIWTSMLQAGGFKQKGTTEDSWLLSSGFEESLGVRINIDGVRRTVLGTRGSAEFAAVAGGPLAFRLVGPVGLANRDLEFEDVIPSDAVAGEPLKLCDANFVMDVLDQGEISPVLKSVKIAAARSIAQRVGNRRTQSVLEVRGVARDPLWECLIEQNRTINWERVLRDETPVGLSMQLSGTLGTLGFKTPLGRSAFLASRPQYQSIGGVLCANLVFGLSGRLDADLEVTRSA